MVFVTAEGITLTIDNSFSIKFDSSRLLTITNLSNQIYLAIARLDEDAFFLTISVNYSETDHLTTWDIIPVVKPLISQIRILPAIEVPRKRFTSNIRSIGIEDGFNPPYQIALTPGKSHHLTNDIVVHLLSRSECSDQGSTDARKVPSEWIFAHRYHMLSSWPTSRDTGTLLPKNQVWDNRNVHSNADQQHANLVDANSTMFPQRDSITGCSSTGTNILHRGTSRKAINFCKHRMIISHSSNRRTSTTNRDGDEHRDFLSSLKMDSDKGSNKTLDAIRQDSRQCHWLSNLSGRVWDVLTGFSLLNPFRHTSTGSD